MDNNPGRPPAALGKPSGAGQTDRVNRTAKRVIAMFEWKIEGRSFRIRDVESDAEFHAIEDIQKEAGASMISTTFRRLLDGYTTWEEFCWDVRSER